MSERGGSGPYPPSVAALTRRAGSRHFAGSKAATTRKETDIMHRITKADLEGAVRALNLATGQPPEPYTREADGALTHHPGNYHLSGAYGGWQVEQMHPSGGVTRALGGGYIPKRELYSLICAMVEGVRAKPAAEEVKP